MDRTITCIDTNIIMGKRLSGFEGNNLVKVLAEKNLGFCEKIAVPEVINV